jgi:hypothetical protein
MVKPGEQNPPSNFDARADNAALALRQGLQRQGRQVPDRAPVEVDSRGNPPPPPPPAGSYAAQNLELARRAQAAQLPQPGQRAEDAMDEGIDPQGQPPQPAAERHSTRAEQRIQELVTQLREKDQALQTALEQGKRATETATQFQARLQSLEQQHQAMLQRNLESLDPETRAQVMQDARLSQRLDEFEQRVLGRIAPQLEHLQQTAAQQEMHALAQKYPGFNYQLHAPLIDRFRARNPACSIEQAFRAVAEPEEIAPRSPTRAQAIPPIVPPGNGVQGAPRYAPQAQPRQQSADEQLVEESRRIAALRRDSDPAKQKEGLRLADEHLRRRLGG